MKKVLSVVLALALVLVMGVVSASAADLKLGSNFKGLDSFKSLTKTSSVKDVTGTKKSAAESTTCVTSEVVTEKIELLTMRTVRTPTLQTRPLPTRRLRSPTPVTPASLL